MTKYTIDLSTAAPDGGGLGVKYTDFAFRTPDFYTAPALREKIVNIHYNGGSVVPILHSDQSTPAGLVPAGIPLGPAYVTVQMGDFASRNVVRLPFSQPAYPLLADYFPDDAFYQPGEPFGNGFPQSLNTIQAKFNAEVQKARDDYYALTIQGGDLIEGATGRILGTVTIDAPITIQQAYNLSFSGESVQKTVIGSPYADTMTGSDTSQTVYVGSAGNDTLRGGVDQNDVFDFQTKGFTGFAPATTQILDGRGVATVGATDGDTLLLPGGPGDYTFTFDHRKYAAPSVTDANLKWSHAETKVTVNTGGHVLGTTNVERVSFATMFTNVVVTPISNLGVALASAEALTLAADVYGPKESLSHKAEALLHDSNAPAAIQYENSATAAAVARGWHALSAIELGMMPLDYNDHPTLRYSFADGFYAAYDKNPVVLPVINDKPEANAMVLTGVFKGKRTLAVAFRGTDQFGDFADYANMAEHYRKFKPLTDELKTYINDPSNGIEQVLVSGHSLGAGIVQHFMRENAGNGRIRAYTVGSPGGDDAPSQAFDGRIMNFVRSDDAVSKVPLITGVLLSDTGKYLLDVVSGKIGEFAGPKTGLTPEFIKQYIVDTLKVAQTKFRIGSEVNITSTKGGPYLPGLEEHDKRTYIDELKNLHTLSLDAASPFFSKPVAGADLAKSIREDTVYTGAPIQVAPGSAGKDIIRPERADDFVLAGAGNDSIVFESFIDATKPRRVIDGGDGFDTITFFGRSKDGFTFPKVGDHHVIAKSTPVGTIPIAEAYRVEALYFPTDPAGLILLNGPGPTVKKAAPGSTTFAADPNFDESDAGDGARTVTGTTANDTITFGSGQKTISGAAGDDLIFHRASGGGGGSGASPPAPADNVVLNGEAGDDMLVGGTGDDLITGGDGNDHLGGGGGTDILRGGAGDDFYMADGPGDTYDESGGSGNDTVETALAAFSLAIGVLGAIENVTGTNETGQSLTGNGLVNAITGGIGGDTLAGAGGADLIDGGAGIDLASGEGSTGLVYLDLLSAPGLFFDGTGAVDLIANIEGAVGGSGGDFLNGDHGANVLRGGGATDAILGRGGNDVIDGGDANDYLMGGDAYDAAQAGSGDDTIDGGAGTDIIFGMGGNDVLRGGGDADFILAGTGNDTVEGGAGNDFLFGGTNYVFDQAGAGNDNMKGGDGVDFIVGGQGSDALDGEAGDDIVYGGSGIDQVRGGAGNDSVFGDAGNDVVLGGAGFDYLYGGAGGDTFWFRKDDSYDTVFDFAAGQGDRLRLDPALGVGTFAQFQTRVAGFTFEGVAYSVLNFAALGFNDQITIKGISHTAWTAGMVEFA